MRPRKIKTPKEFDALVNKYVDECANNGDPVTWTGMALFMGFAGRVCIDEYLKYEGFSYSVKRAKTIVENAYEKKLHSGNAAGPIFALKNFGWTDRQELTVMAENPIVIETYRDDATE